MTLIKHELKQSRVAVIVWTAAIGFLLAVCIFMYPEMKGDMDGISDMFSSMGSFSEAFGMDKISFGTLTGFYAVECGNILGLGGAFFASLCAISVLAKEENERTAEFLLTHPIIRQHIITGKLISVFIQIIILNAVVYGISIGSIAIVGEEIPFTEISLLHLAYLLMQIELAGICFGISAFIRRGSIGIGLGVAVIMYFLNIVANISDSAEFLKYITPFGYAEGTEIVNNLSLDGVLILLGMVYAAVGIAAAYIKYSKKDIA
ncbi:MAG: ABC transporter permease subunit [Acutalibacteraceae bacterium]